jgi:SAM-dependent methyltransferase
MVAATEPRWGSQPIDPGAPNLPALKVRYLLERLPDSGDVMEVGSGDGKILRTFAQQRPHLRLAGCDVRAWAAPEPGIAFRRITSNDLPFEDASFDAVVIVDTLEHVDDPEHLVAELARVLRPRGRFIGFVPVEGEPRSMYALYRKLLGEDLYVRTKEHVQSYTFDAVSRLLATRFELAHVEYSYHAIGHLMDATFFAAAALPRIGRFWWRENRYYATPDEKPGALASVLNRMLEVGNAVAYVESRLLARWRLGAAGMLFDARRRDMGDARHG